MGFLTVACCEEAGLFEYFSVLGSQAGCSIVKAPYCISFLCQSPVSCGGAVSNDDPQLPESRMETGLPRALEPHRQPPSNLRALTLSAFKSFHALSCLDLFSYFLLTLPSFISLSSIFSYLPPPDCPPPCFPPPFVPLCRSEERLSGVSCRSTPSEGISVTTISDARQKQGAYACIYM